MVDTNVEVHVHGISCKAHEIYLTSQEYGTEIFKYDTLSDALMGAARLLEKALELDDGVKRTIRVSWLP